MDCAVICTPQAAAGLDRAASAPLQIARSDEEFVESVVQTLQRDDVAASRPRDYVLEHYDWERNLAHDPEARLRIASRIYDVTVTPVTSPELTGTLDTRYETQYDMEAVFGEAPPDWRYYEIAVRER